ncbi:MAG: hypothetical protein ACP5I8_10390 [Phycisphaerae bacterium]
MHYRTAKVSLHGRVAGKLEELVGGATRLAYGKPPVRGNFQLPWKASCPDPCDAGHKANYENMKII